jgi:hypothetical protein
MAVRYFCDRCDNEVREGELRVAELSLPPEPDITIDLCPTCAEHVRSDILGRAEPQRAGAPS